MQNSRLSSSSTPESMSEPACRQCLNTNLPRRDGLTVSLRHPRLQPYMPSQRKQRVTAATQWPPRAQRMELLRNQSIVQDSSSMSNKSEISSYAQAPLIFNQPLPKRGFLSLLNKPHEESPVERFILSRHRQTCRDACLEFNQAAAMPSSESQHQLVLLFLQILQENRIGTNLRVSPPFHAEFGVNITVRDNVTIGEGCYFKDSGDILIGKNTMVGYNVKIFAEWICPQRGWKHSITVKIGENVVIGHDTMIWSGKDFKSEILIGDNAKIGFGSVISSDIPNNAVVPSVAEINEKLSFVHK